MHETPWSPINGYLQETGYFLPPITGLTARRACSIGIQWGANLAKCLMQFAAGFRNVVATWPEEKPLLNETRNAKSNDLLSQKGLSFTSQCSCREEMWRRLQESIVVETEAGEVASLGNHFLFPMLSHWIQGITFHVWKLWETASVACVCFRDQDTAWHCYMPDFRVHEYGTDTSKGLMMMAHKNP